MKIVCTFFCAVLLCGCYGPSVRARSFYTSRKDLASCAVDSPDPEKSTKRLGQMVWVRWRCPKLTENTRLFVTLRFHDGLERNEQYPIDRRRGWLKVEITPQEKKEHNGLLSYRIELREGEKVLSATQHKLWVQSIKVEESNCST